MRSTHRMTEQVRALSQLTLKEALQGIAELTEQVRTANPLCLACGEYVSAGQAKLIWSSRVARRVSHDTDPCKDRALRLAYGDPVVNAVRETLSRSAEPEVAR
jgi:hypothetical protein